MTFISSSFGDLPGACSAYKSIDDLQAAQDAFAYMQRRRFITVRTLRSDETHHFNIRKLGPGSPVISRYLAVDFRVFEMIDDIAHANGLHLHVQEIANSDKEKILYGDLYLTLSLQAPPFQALNLNPRSVG